MNLIIIFNNFEKNVFFLLNLLPFLDKTRPSSEIFTQQPNITQDRPRYILYSETLNNEYIERIHQMSYSSLSDNGMLALQIFSFLIK